jgi:beta-lactamase regulating signal transducer with metallopeptidase domain
MNANSRYMLSTLLLVAALIGYFALSSYFSGPRASQAIGQTESQIEEPRTQAPPTTEPRPVSPPDRPAGADESRERMVWITVAGILAAAALLIVLVARLQKRRRDAYQKAAEQERRKQPRSAKPR